MVVVAKLKWNIWICCIAVSSNDFFKYLYRAMFFNRAVIVVSLTLKNHFKSPS